MEKRDRNLQWGLDRSRSIRDVAEDYPSDGDKATRDACRHDLRKFFETYFPNAFPLAWSDDHIKVIGRLQEVLTVGGLFALAMPRGSGKTTMAIRAAVWALLYGHRRFVSLIGATERHAEQLLTQIKTELMFNDALFRDFPWVCHPLRKLENNARRCNGQLFDGEQTRIGWTADRLSFPTMPDVACYGEINVSGATVTVAGITGAIRGQTHVLASGEILRPEVAILDDPQTRESAMSLAQSERRMQIIKGDVMGMAGPGRDIAAIMPCTVIQDGDLAAEMLDREKNPEWSGQKAKLVYAFPTNEKLWDQYNQLRAESLKAGKGEADATEFYRANREAMDAGAVIAWPARYKVKTELSAIQHAMNLLALDRAAFFAEYQNEPLQAEAEATWILKADEIAAKVNRLPRREVPLECDRLTAFIDVHGTVLYYSVVAWDQQFGGAVIDYGTFPEQPTSYFALRDARRTLDHVVKAAGMEGRIYGGLEALAERILGREYQRSDETNFRVERCLIDANWGTQSDVVYRFCRESKYASILMPSHGKGIGASAKPLSEYTVRPGERIGLNWFMPMDARGTSKRKIRRVIFDANFWKSFVHARLAVAKGDRGSLTLFGDRPMAHKLYADHLLSERPIPVRREGSSRTVDEWKMPAERPDNHYFDTLVGCAVAASMQGVVLAESAAPKKTAKRVSFAELSKRKRV